VQTVLAVDDSASIRQMVAFTLEQAGFEVIQAADGLDALKVAADHIVDLVITDLNMPRLDGFGLIEKLRALPEYRFVPMLVLTTDSGSDRKRRGKAAGATGWLVKPFNPEQLIATIRRVLD